MNVLVPTPPTVPMYTSSETLDVSNVEKLSVRILKCDTNYFGRGSQIFEWWISNLSVVKECSAIRSIAFEIVSPTSELDMHVTLDWDDLWTRLDECLASYKMASLERFALTFWPRPAEWDIQDPYRGEISPTKAAWPRSSIEIVFSFDIPDVWRAMYKSLSSFTIT
ncbi:uncharacterized protein ARMOST_10405 [Armillaria ostoyae]|uniref:Uncharacterized protein n=1 Tax=Armillaria ostoyae TaxID=47428 RepID=A0A284RE74_ARMOS|nr:uncharacterized protein ARMOST_10405 [Armillaria ostoyae]